jgi:hypothetical protein
VALLQIDREEKRRAGEIVYQRGHKFIKKGENYDIAGVCNS